MLVANRKTTRISRTRGNVGQRWLRRSSPRGALLSTNTQVTEPTADRPASGASAPWSSWRGYVTVTEFFSNSYAAAVPLQMRYLGWTVCGVLEEWLPAVRRRPDDERHQAHRITGVRNDDDRGRAWGRIDGNADGEFGRTRHGRAQRAAIQQDAGGLGGAETRSADAHHRSRGPGLRRERTDRDATSARRIARVSDAVLVRVALVRVRDVAAVVLSIFDEVVVGVSFASQFQPGDRAVGERWIRRADRRQSQSHFGGAHAINGRGNREPEGCRDGRLRFDGHRQSGQITDVAQRRGGIERERGGLRAEVGHGKRKPRPLAGLHDLRAEVIEEHRHGLRV